MKQKNYMLLTPVFAAAAAAVYMLLVNPVSERLTQNRVRLGDLRNQCAKMTADIKNISVLQEKIKAIESELADKEKLQLNPLLESYAMQAKAHVGQLAHEAGIVDAEFTERPLRALPVLPGQPVPANLHARRPVMMTCRGDYPAIVSFVMRVEKDLPHVALESLRIVPSADTPELQYAEIVLEWPAKGEGK